MKPVQMSIACILGFVVACAIGFAVLRGISAFPAPPVAQEFWEGVVAAFTAQVLVFSAVRACSTREKRRAFWLGFLACGGGYVALCFYPWHDPWGQSYIARSWSGTLPLSVNGTPLVLPTSRFLDMLWQPYQRALGKPNNLYSEFSSYVHIGHLLFGWLIGWIGGVLASTVYGIVSVRGAESSSSLAGTPVREGAHQPPEPASGVAP